MNILDRCRFLLITGFGLGLVPFAPGTFGTLAGLLPAVLLPLWFEGIGLIIALWALAGLLFAFGCAQTAFSLRVFAKPDPGAFVLDEVVGYLVAAALYVSIAGEASPAAHAIGFFMFRVFDILKPPPIGRLEEYPGAFGIMIDDVAAGLYAGGLLALTQALGVIA
ncbi:MAG: phosphatidylglycerophosphatase A family protein [Planctomycetota bacterium]|jgi:phosphatidylglycerophosphatase A